MSPPRGTCVRVQECHPFFFFFCFHLFPYPPVFESRLVALFFTWGFRWSCSVAFFGNASLSDERWRMMLKTGAANWQKKISHLFPASPSCSSYPKENGRVTIVREDFCPEWRFEFMLDHFLRNLESYCTCIISCDQEARNC